MDNNNRSKKTQCIEDLRRKVLTEVLEPGVYPDETELADIYGISRPPLGEVLRQQAGEATSFCTRTGGRRSLP